MMTTTTTATAAGIEQEPAMAVAGPSQSAASFPARAHQASTSSLLQAPTSWVQSIDATYTLFEDSRHRHKHSRLALLVEKAVRLCEEVLEELGEEHCALSFNGGKDCTVLVHMLAAVLRRRAQKRHAKEDGDALAHFASLYITCSSPFAEVERFVHDSIRRYNLRLVRQDGGMKQGLERYLNGEGEERGPTASNGHVASVQHSTNKEHKRQRDIKAIFVGTRRTDPHGADLQPRNKTDPGWPDVERVQPILDWTYEDVWLFLRCPLFAISKDRLHSDEGGLQWGATYGVPYCSLYDEGYTSLGSTFNTFPNPVLDTQKGDPVHDHDAERRKHRWLPAYHLKDESLERAGRVSAKGGDSQPVSATMP